MPIKKGLCRFSSLGIEVREVRTAQLVLGERLICERLATCQSLGTNTLPNAM